MISFCNFENDDEKDEIIKVQQKARDIPPFRIIKEFLFPASFEALLPSSNSASTNYTVSFLPEKLVLMNYNSIMSMIQQIDHQFDADYVSITQPRHFDLIFSLINGFENNLLFKQMKILQETIKKLVDWTNYLLRTTKSLASDQDPYPLRNTLKMVLFLGFYMVQTTIQTKKAKTNMMQKLDEVAKKKKKREAVNQDLSAVAQKHQWELINIISSVISEVEFQKLWAGMQLENTFLQYFISLSINLIAGSMTKDETMRKIVWRIFNGVLILNPLLMKTLKKQLLRNILDSQITCQNSIEIFKKSNSAESQALFRHTALQSLGIMKQNKNSMIQNQQMRNLSNFLTQLSDKYCQMFLDYLKLFMSMYDSQSYTIRNAISSIIFNIIRKLFKEPTQQNKRIKETLLMVLLERVYDKVVHARSHALALVLCLVEENILEKHLVQQAFKRAIERMCDQSVNPRKKATSLVFQCSKKFFYLFRSTEADKLMKREQILKQIQIIEISISSLQTMEQDLRKQISECEDQVEMQSLLSDAKIQQRKIKQNKAMVQHYKLYHQILQIIQKSLPILKTLLNSVSSTDVIQTIKLVVYYKRANIQNIDEILINTWKLVYHTELSVVNQAFNSFVSLHFADADSRAASLIKVFTEADPKSRLCYQTFVKMMMDRNKDQQLFITQSLVEQIWERFRELVTNRRQNEKNPQQRKSIIVLLKAIFKNNHRMIKNSYNIFALTYIESHLMNREQYPDPKVLCFLFSLYTMNSRQLDWKTKQHFVFQSMQLLWEDVHYPIHVWCQVVEELIDSGFRVCAHPQVFLKNFLIKLTDQHEKAKHNHTQNKQSDGKQFMNMTLRLYFFLGHTISRLSELANEMCDLTREAVFKGIGEVRKRGQLLMNQTQDPNQRNKIQDWSNGEALAFQYQGDYIIKQYQNRSDRLVYDYALRFWVMQTINCVKKVIKKGPTGSAIERISVINYGKIMAACKSFATDNARDLITVMTTCPDESLRINAIITFADAISQNSSAMSPYSDGIFQCILDKNRRVQFTALDAIWYLVMGDIMLFDNQVFYIALVFESQSQEVKEYCKRFLLEKNRREECFLMNKVPQVVSELSDENKFFGARQVTSKTYEAYARQIIPQLQKGKQKSMIEAVTISLLQIVKKSLNPLLTRNACLTISLLAHTDKSIIKVIEGYRLIDSKIKDDDVCLSYFKELIVKLRRNARGELKDLVDEFQSKFISNSQGIFVRKTKLTEEINQKATKANRTNNKGKRQPKKKNQKNIQISDSDDDKAISVASDSPVVRQRHQRRGQQKQIQVQVIQDSQVQELPSRARRGARVSSLEQDQ